MNVVRAVYVYYFDYWFSLPHWMPRVPLVTEGPLSIAMIGLYILLLRRSYVQGRSEWLRSWHEDWPQGAAIYLYARWFWLFSIAVRKAWLLLTPWGRRSIASRLSARRYHRLPLVSIRADGTPVFLNDVHAALLRYRDVSY